MIRVARGGRVWGEMTHFHPMEILQSTPLWRSESISLWIKYLNHLDSLTIIALYMNSMSRVSCVEDMHHYESSNSHWYHERFSFFPTSVFRHLPKKQKKNYSLQFYVTTLGLGNRRKVSRSLDNRFTSQKGEKEKKNINEEMFKH